MIAMTLATRFALEVAGLVALGYAAAQHVHGPARWIAAILAPAALAAIWGLVVAPKATNGLPLTAREMIGTVLLLAVAGALAGAGRPVPAMIFATLIVANAAVLAATHAAATHAATTHAAAVHGVAS